jgi:hypothetical protein
MTIEEYQAVSPAFDADVYQVLDPLMSIQKRKAIGGTNPQSVRDQLAGIQRLRSLETSRGPKPAPAGVLRKDVGTEENKGE